MCVRIGAHRRPRHTHGTVPTPSPLPRTQNRASVCLSRTARIIHATPSYALSLTLFLSPWLPLSPPSSPTLSVPLSFPYPLASVPCDPAKRARDHRTLRVTNKKKIAPIGSCEWPTQPPLSLPPSSPFTLLAAVVQCAHEGGLVLTRKRGVVYIGGESIDLTFSMPASLCSHSAIIATGAHPLAAFSSKTFLSLFSTVLAPPTVPQDGSRFIYLSSLAPSLGPSTILSLLLALAGSRSHGSNVSPKLADAAPPRCGTRMHMHAPRRDPSRTGRAPSIPPKTLAILPRPSVSSLGELEEEDATPFRATFRNCFGGKTANDYDDGTRHVRLNDMPPVDASDAWRRDAPPPTSVLTYGCVCHATPRRNAFLHGKTNRTRG